MTKIALVSILALAVSGSAAGAHRTVTVYLKERLGSKVDVEWTVEGRRGRVPATVVDLPFLDLERKRA